MIKVETILVHSTVTLYDMEGACMEIAYLSVKV